MKFYIDRISDIAAVCEDEIGLQFRFPLQLLPSNILECGVLLLENGIFTVDEKACEERRKEIEALQKAAFSDE